MEGFTDYVTWRVLTGANLIEARSVLTQLRRQLSAYLNLKRTGPIGAASKRDNEGYVFVYEGGSLFALCLDGAIREGSGGARTILDFMGEVYRRSAMEGAPCDKALLVAVATELAGRDLEPYFTRFIDGMEELPLDESLGKLGIRLERGTSGDRVSVKVEPDESAAVGVATIRDRFLGRG